MKTTETAEVLKLRLEHVTEQLELVTAENEHLKNELIFKENILSNAQLTINHWKKYSACLEKDLQDIKFTFQSLHQQNNTKKDQFDYRFLKSKPTNYSWHNNNLNFHDEIEGNYQQQNQHSYYYNYPKYHQPNFYDVGDNRKINRAKVCKMYIYRQHEQVVKSPVIVIDMISVQNLLAPFFCVCGRETF